MLRDLSQSTRRPYRLVVGMASLLAAMLTTATAQLNVGDQSDDVEFALFSNGSLSNSSLSNFDDNITVFFYFTPW